MIVAVFHRSDDKTPWMFIDTYHGDTLEDAVKALLSREGQALAVDLCMGTAYKLSQSVRVVASTAVTVDDEVRPYVEQPAVDDKHAAKDEPAHSGERL